MEDWQRLPREEFEKLVQPPPPRKNPHYCVARQRAHQQIHNTHGCRDISLKRKRLQDALVAATDAGLDDTVIDSTRDELTFAKGVEDSRLHRKETPEPPPFQEQPMRSVTPVRLRSLGNLQFGPGIVAFLNLRDDGIAELRDVADPSGPPLQTCQVFEKMSTPAAEVFATMHEKVPGTPEFSHQSLWELFFFCEPFRAVVAVVDVLRPSGQVLCSQLLSKGPQGPLIGVIAACPSNDTPVPFAGPSYGAMSALLCLGCEGRGLGGFRGAGGGVFGRCLAMVDRAVAYDGGWPSPKLGLLAFQLASAAEASESAGGMAGSFLFGCEPGSPEELARAESTHMWLQDAGKFMQASHAWAHHFSKCAILNSEHKDGLMWIDETARCGFWPHMCETSAGESPPEAGADEVDEEDEAQAEAVAAAKAAAAENAAAKAM
jgi:hypothetical protein